MISKQIKNATKEVQEKYLATRSGYDLSTGEVVEIIELFKVEPFDAVLTAFNYGFAKGVRYIKAKKRKGGKR